MGASRMGIRPSQDLDATKLLCTYMYICSDSELPPSQSQLGSVAQPVQRESLVFPQIDDLYEVPVCGDTKRYFLNPLSRQRLDAPIVFLYLFL